MSFFTSCLFSRYTWGLLLWDNLGCPLVQTVTTMVSVNSPPVKRSSKEEDYFYSCPILLQKTLDFGNWTNWIPLSSLWLSLFLVVTTKPVCCQLLGMWECSHLDRLLWQPGVWLICPTNSSLDHFISSRNLYLSARTILVLIHVRSLHVIGFLTFYVGFCFKYNF